MLTVKSLFFRPGRRTRHLFTAPPRFASSEHRHVHLQPSGQPLLQSGPIHCLQQLTQRVRSPGLRAGILDDEPERAGDLGSSVRRLLQHRPVHH